MYQFNRKEYEERMKWYQDARFGMFIHWGLYSIPARGEWVRSTEEMPEEEYLPFMKEFDARDYNPKQWAKEGITSAFCIRIPVSIIMSRLPETSLTYVGMATPITTVYGIIFFVICFRLLNKNSAK